NDAVGVAADLHRNQPGRSRGGGLRRRGVGGFGVCFRSSLRLLGAQDERRAQRTEGHSRRECQRQDDSGTDAHYFASSGARKALRISRCFTSESGSFTCWTNTTASEVTARTEPSSRRSLGRTR